MQVNYSAESKFQIHPQLQNEKTADHICSIALMNNTLCKLKCML